MSTPVDAVAGLKKLATDIRNGNVDNGDAAFCERVAEEHAAALLLHAVDVADDRKSE